MILIPHIVPRRKKPITNAAFVRSENITFFLVRDIDLVSKLVGEYVNSVYLDTGIEGDYLKKEAVSGSYLRFPGKDSYSNLDDFTIHIRMRANTAAEKSIMVCDSISAGKGFDITYNPGSSGKINFRFEFSNHQFSGSLPAVGETYTLTLTRSASNNFIKGYRDKTNFWNTGASTYTGPSITTPLQIGASTVLPDGAFDFEYVVIRNRALSDTEVAEFIDNPWAALTPRRIYIPLFPAAGGADVTISADPLTSLNTLAGSPVIDVAHSANPLTSSNTLTGQQVTDVSIGATPLASVNALAGDFVVDATVLAGSLTSLNTLAGSPVIDVTVAAGALTSLNTLVGTAQVGGDVNITADVLSSLNTLAGAVVIDATVAAETLTSLNTLAGTVSLGGDVNIAADPLTSLNALTGSSVIDAVISTTPLVSVNTLTGVASTVTNVTVNAEALTSLNTLAGIPVIDVIVAANPFASVNTLAGAYSAGAAFNANINTSWTGTLNLPGETPTLTLDAENLTLDLPGEP